MVAILRTEWSGTSGGPGVTQIALLGAAGGIWNPTGAQAAVNAMRAFWFSQVAMLPNELTLTVSPVIDDYDVVTGDLVGSYTAATPPAPVAGGSAGNYAAGAGYKVTWNTGQIRNGRRVRGSTFVVPAASGVYDANGRISTATINSVNGYAATLISALASAETSMGVWSRPWETPNPRTGFATQVVSGACSTKTAILRGRRD